MLNLLKELTAKRGVAGDETEIADFIMEIAAPLCDSVHKDILGNVIAFKKGKSSEKTVMADAHMDEIGLMISHITDDGMFKFEEVGGIDPRVINGRRVLIGPNRVIGIIGTKAIHLQSLADREVAPQSESLFIDIGAKDKKEAQKLVSIGDTAIFDSDYVEFGEGFIKARALDNRAGCYVLLEAMKETPAYDTYFVFSVLEEVGGHGAKVAATKIKPDMAIVVDTTTAADYIEKHPHRRSSTLGSGTVIFYMESTTIYKPENVAKVKKAADKNKIKWQLKTVTLGGLNSGSVQRSGDGVETVAIATPCRYIHSNAPTLKADDLEETIKLMKALLEDKDFA